MPDVALSANALIAASRRPNVQRVLVLAAIVGLGLGLETLFLHLTTDPLADVQAYYDAGARLNAGEPLYVQAVGTDDAAFYRYPPLLAIAFRPLALLPFGVAAAIWEAILVGLFALTIVRLGPGLRTTWLVVGMLALPTAWALVIGQAQIAVTFLMALGSPWALALATNLKVLPALVAVFWIGRRDWRSVGWFVVWLAILGLVQLAVEPSGTTSFPAQFGLAQVGNVNNYSLFGISPWLWAAAVVIGLGVALRMAATPVGWGIAVALSVLATPRLLLYQLATLVAAVRGPAPAGGDRADPATDSSRGPAGS